MGKEKVRSSLCLQSACLSPTTATLPAPEAPGALQQYGPRLGAILGPPRQSLKGLFIKQAGSPHWLLCLPSVCLARGHRPPGVQSQQWRHFQLLELNSPDGVNSLLVGSVNLTCQGQSGQQAVCLHGFSALGLSQ